MAHADSGIKREAITKIQLISIKMTTTDKNYSENEN